jgi:hypothetical protein
MRVIEEWIVATRIGEAGNRRRSFPPARDALRLLASIRGRTVECGETRENLIAAARAWAEESRRIEEFNQSDQVLE